jgi:hypothetical protein
MTPQQLLHLADPNDEAAAWTTNPSWQRSFTDAANRARLLAERQERAHRAHEMRSGLQEIKALAR